MILKNDYSRIVQNQRQEDENLEEHRFDANNLHSRLNLTTENVMNDMDVDLEMDGDHPSKSCRLRILYLYRVLMTSFYSKWT